MHNEEQSDMYDPYEGREQREINTYWHLDKKVPISIIIALFFQTISFIYVGTAWKTEIDFRITSLEKDSEERKTQESRIVAVEQQIHFIAETVTRIDSRLDGKFNSGASP